jgi:2-hydroxychromene-2-carboxylate isomerase
MVGTIDFYFDFSSPYGYFASTRIEELAARYGREVQWHPMLLGIIFKSSGSMPLTMMPLKGDYAYHDFERTARFHDIAYRRPPIFPVATQATARAMMWIQANHGEAKAIEFAKAAYRAYFYEGILIGDGDNVAKIASDLGLDAEALMDGINSAEIKEKLKTDTEKGMARGVFGSPFIIVDGESFWGFDRLYQVEALLKNGKI